MIRRLRKRFIRIATLAVTAVLLVLCLSVNIANYISVDSGLTNVLNVISDNRGTMPPCRTASRRRDARTDSSRRKRPSPRAISSCAMTETEISSRRIWTRSPP